MRIKLNSGITKVSERENAPSAEEIRNKFEQRNKKNKIGSKKEAKADKVEISQEAKEKSVDAKKVDESKDEKAENDDFEIGDIKKNDPKDPVTKEKLKDVLRNGSFHFSAAERAALGEILED